MKPRLAHRCSPAIGSAPWPKFLPSVVKPLEVRNVCWELCCADELGRRWLPSCRSQKGMKAWGRGSSGWSGCLSVFQQVHPKASEIPCDSSPWHFLANILYPPYTLILHILNYQDLNFCEWLQPELSSSRWECPNADKGLHLLIHTFQKKRCSFGLTSWPAQEVSCWLQTFPNRSIHYENVCHFFTPSSGFCLWHGAFVNLVVLKVQVGLLSNGSKPSYSYLVCTLRKTL